MHSESAREDRIRSRTWIEWRQGIRRVILAERQDRSDSTGATTQFNARSVPLRFSWNRLLFVVRCSLLLSLLFCFRSSARRNYIVSSRKGLGY